MNDEVTSVRWPRDSKAQLQLACLVRGESVSGFIRRVVMQEVERELGRTSVTASPKEVEV